MSTTVFAVAQAIQLAGETVTLRRLDSARAGTDVAVKGTVRLWAASGGEIDLAGSAVEYRYVINITNLEIVAALWPGPPRRRDQVIRDGITLTVDAVDTRKYGEEIVMHILYCAG